MRRIRITDIVGFTLIELLVIVALLGAFLIGLLATIDPFEQLKKGSDTTRADISQNIYNALIRAYASRSSFPMSQDIANASLDSPEGSSLVQALTSQGELKTHFLSLVGSQAKNIYITASQDGKSLYVCFTPESKSYKNSPQTIYTAGQSENHDCSSSSCFYCIGGNPIPPNTQTQPPTGITTTTPTTPTHTPTRTPTPSPTISPTPSPSGPYSNTSAVLIPGKSTFTFSTSLTSTTFTIDMSTNPTMAWDTYLTFSQGTSSPIVITNPEKWDKYVCWKDFYWTIRSSGGVTSPITHSIVDCGPSPTPTISPTPSPSPAPSDPAITKNVLVIDFNPILENQGGKRLRTYKGWNNPIGLENQYISDLRTASNGYFNYQIVERLADLDAYPTKNNGYVFTDDSYLAALSNADTNARAIINYNKILTDYDVCGKVNRGEIDELWLWGGPWFGYWEAVMAGPGAYWTNGSPILNTTCTRKLHILGFSYERGVPEMLEDFGHRTEGTMRTVFSGWFSGGNTDWDKFTKSRAFHPNDGVFSYGCGSIHEPFNASGGYDWGNVSAIANTCSAWTNYPPAPTTLQTQTCSIWGCTGYGYLKMWLTHLPKATGQTNGKWNNWWKYIGDVN